MTATELRKHIYQVLDTVQHSGQPQYVTRRGHVFQIRAVRSTAMSIDTLPEISDLVTGDAGDLAEVHWDKTWQP